MRLRYRRATNHSAVRGTPPDEFQPCSNSSAKLFTELYSRALRGRRLRLARNLPVRFADCDARADRDRSPIGWWPIGRNRDGRLQPVAGSAPCLDKRTICPRKEAKNWNPSQVLW